MVVTTITVVYGSILTWGDVIRLGFVDKDDVWYSWEQPEKPHELTFNPVPHDIVRALETSNPEKLPPSYRAIMDKKNEPEITECFNWDNNPYQLFYVGIECGEVSFSRYQTAAQSPSLEQILKAEEKFFLTIGNGPTASKFGELRGMTDVHFVPNDCACCS